MPGFVSAATGGNGSTCVYNSKHATSGTIAHESGHNLATAAFGTPYPGPSTEYGKAQLVEKPVSEYGGKSTAEDFAEVANHYNQNREALKQKVPLKFKAFEELLKTTPTTTEGRAAAKKSMDDYQKSKDELKRQGKM